MSELPGFWHCYACDLSRSDDGYDAHLGSAEHLTKVRARLTGWENCDTSSPSPTEGYSITRLPTTVSGLELLK